MYDIARRNQRKKDHTELYLTYSYLLPLLHYEDLIRPLIRIEETRFQPSAEYTTVLPDGVEIVLYPLDGSIEVAQAPQHICHVGGAEICRIRTVAESSFKFTNSSEEVASFLEFWFEAPDSGDQTQIASSQQERPKGFYAFHPVASGQGYSESMELQSDTAIYFSRLRPNDNLVFETTLDRSVVVFILDGAVKVAEDRILTGDSMLLYRETSIELSAQQRTNLFLIDLPGASSVDPSSV